MGSVQLRRWTLYMQLISARVLIGDCSYSRGESTELIAYYSRASDTERPQVTITYDSVRQRTIAYKNYNMTLQNMTHFITFTDHLNPNLPTSVVFLMIHDNLLIAFWRTSWFLTDGRVLAHHGGDAVLTETHHDDESLLSFFFFFE